MNISEQDLNDLKHAKKLLENPGLAAKLTDIIGKPIEKGMNLLPGKWQALVNTTVTKSLRTSLDFAIKTLNREKKSGAGNLFHKIAAAASGGIGGAFGLASLPLELPVSTTIMLRSIADIAKSQGEDIDDIGSRLACLEVFALGGESKSDDATETGYYAVRAALAGAISEATRYIAKYGVVERGAPPLVRLIMQISSRFGIVVSQKVAATAVPLVGAGSGAVVNTLFIDHFQKMATGHFIVRRLERKYGKSEIKELYTEISQEK